MVLIGGRERDRESKTLFLLISLFRLNKYFSVNKSTVKSYDWIKRKKWKKTEHHEVYHLIGFRYLNTANGTCFCLSFFFLLKNGISLTFDEILLIPSEFCCDAKRKNKGGKHFSIFNLKPLEWTENVYNVCVLAKKFS